MKCQKHKRYRAGDFSSLSGILTIFGNMYMSRPPGAMIPKELGCCVWCLSQN